MRLKKKKNYITLPGTLTLYVHSYFFALTSFEMSLLFCLTYCLGKFAFSTPASCFVFKANIFQVNNEVLKNTQKTTNARFNLLRLFASIHNFRRAML